MELSTICTVNFPEELDFLRERFRYLREESGHSMRRIAQDMDLHEQTLYTFLAGVDPRYSTVVKIAAWCDAQARYLLWIDQARTKACSQ